MVNEKLAKFERLAERRVTKTIKKLRLIGNLSNKANYSYSENHVQQIMDALDREMDVLKSKFKEEVVPEAIIFKFQKQSGNGGVE